MKSVASLLLALGIAAAFLLMVERPSQAHAHADAAGGPQARAGEVVAKASTKASPAPQAFAPMPQPTPPTQELFQTPETTSIPVVAPATATTTSPLEFPRVPQAAAAVGPQAAPASPATTATAPASPTLRGEADQAAGQVPDESCPPTISASVADETQVSPTDQDITVMTRNLYLGADLQEASAAAVSGDPEAIIAADSAAWNNVKKTNFPERAEVLADEIKQSRPLLVGLQEAALWRSGPPDSFSEAPTPAPNVEFDYLAILLEKLNERGLHYFPVVCNKNADVENPALDADSGMLKDIRLTDRDVILARSDLPVSNLSNAQKANFFNNLSFPIGNAGKSITILRGWVSVDVQAGGKKFRFINTHLEQENSQNPAFNPIQLAQANELLSGPANTSLPVILEGDFNSRADGSGTPTYANLIGAGFADAWGATHPGEPGNTCCHASDLLDAAPLTQRIDLVLLRGGLSAFGADAVGEELTDRTPSGLWPSDHAGVVASLG